MTDGIAGSMRLQGARPKRHQLQRRQVVHLFTRKWLPAGAYSYRFAARQGSWWAYWPSPAGSYASGPTVGP